MSGSGISWAICKSAPCSRQTTTPAPHYSVFLQAGCPSCRPTNSVKALVKITINQSIDRLIVIFRSPTQKEYMTLLLTGSIKKFNSLQLNLLRGTYRIVRSRIDSGSVLRRACFLYIGVSDRRYGSKSLWVSEARLATGTAQHTQSNLPGPAARRAVGYRRGARAWHATEDRKLLVGNPRCCRVLRWAVGDRLYAAVGAKVYGVCRRSLNNIAQPS